jgi:putative ABC transport system permease protein
MSDGREVDLVVGAKGSPLQLVLSAVYHLDQPTGNVPLAALATLRANPDVASGVPLALGDNFDGFRIVGTEPAFLELYGADLASGRPFERSSEVVIGSRVASATGAGLGQRFVGSHRLSEDGGEHDHAPFEVVGILAPTGTVVDRLIVAPLESVWDVHGIEHTDASEEEHEHDHVDAGHMPEPEITAILVTYRNPAATLRLPPTINRQTNMQAASPAREGARLISLFGAAIDAVSAFGWLLAGTGGLAIFAALYNAVRLREGDLALLRVMGAGRGYVLSIVMLEGVVIAVLGALCGIALAHALLWAAGELYPAVSEAGISAARFYIDELFILGAVALIGLAASLLPASAVYRGSLLPILNRN